jgi:pyruvate dehydrogenase E2 component (dihydrolipoamide acetyltransferase)
VPIEVTMPKLSPTMETGVITQWLKQVGDEVKEGDTLAEIETDKATMEMKSYDDGIIVHLDHAAGDEVALGQRVLVLARKGEDPKEVAAALGVGKPAGAPAPPGPARPALANPAGPASRSGEVEAASVRERAAKDGPGAAASPGEAGPAAGRPRTSPLARKMAEAAHLDISQVRGSGPGGRVIRRDIEALLEAKPQSPPAAGAAPAPAATRTILAAATEPPPPTATAIPRPGVSTAPLVAERIPHSRMRRTIAQRMLAAKQNIPEIHLTVEARVDRLVAARTELNERLATEGIKLSLGDFVTKVVAVSLRSHPALNASFEPDAIVRHGEINIGIAVALSDGLIVPVLRGADLLGLREIRVQTEALATAARAKRLTSEQLAGGTFTISNLGMYGIREFDAIVNPPEVAILSVGASEKRPVVEGDRVVAGVLMALTITADHRAVDGATAAEFLQTVKGLLEQPAAMLL